MEPEVPSVPAGIDEDVFNKLTSTRRDAISAVLLAQEAERTARQLRRTANARLRHYERLLEEHNGQLTIDQVEVG